MPRPTNNDALFASFIEQLADALAARLGKARSAAPAAAPAKAARRRKGEKRAPGLIADMTAQLLAHIKSNSGLRIEQIASALKLSTADLKLPAQKLLADRKVKTRGTRRGTRYFAA